MTQPDSIRNQIVRGVWRGKRANDLFIRDFPAIHSDEKPPEGADTAPTPLEITLAGLCA
jgi:hypothetical protein